MRDAVIRKVKGKLNRRTGWGAALGALLLVPLLALATPEDDFKTGSKAFDDGDVVGAMEPLKRAADAGHAGAQALYAYILDKSENDDEAIEYYRKSVAQEDPDGMFGFAGMMLGGEGIPVNVPEARRLIRAAAEKGHEQAQIVMGLSYLKGGLGLTDEERASPEAARWIGMAAALKNLDAMRAMRDAYTNGGFGQPADAVKAAALSAEIQELTAKEDEPKRRRRRR